MSISVATWNAQWATISSARGPRISAVLDAAGADVTVVTEGHRDLLPSTGSVVDAGNDWGYGPQPSRRKVIVWSRFPLSVDAVGGSGAARGRLAVATATTPHGPVRIIGVCIPWRDAHVTTGRRDAQPWSEHMDYLDRLEELLAGLDDEVPTVIAGDFNQRIPRERQPIRVAERLNDVLADWAIHTAGSLPNGPHIDHIATNRRLTLESARDWPASDHVGRLSDHAGIACRLGYAGAPVLEADEGSALGASPLEQRPGATTAPDHAPANYSQPDGTAAAFDGALTPELRMEIEDILRRSGDGLSHGATFRLREQGLNDAAIAAERGVSVNATRVFLRSLDALLAGTLPTTKSLALNNSYAYREVLNHPRSENLDSYVRAQLRELQEVNPEVSCAPLQTRSHQYRAGTRKNPRPIEDVCPECAALGITHSGRC